MVLSVINDISYVDFTLDAFASSFTLSNSALIIDGTHPALDCSATLVLTSTIPVADIKKVFFFRTDELIASVDSSFVYFYTDTAQWPTTVSATPIRDTLNPWNGTVTNNFFVAGDIIGRDFIRELARQLFGTHLGADLFTNETTLMLDISGQCDTVGTAVRGKLWDVDMANTGSAFLYGPDASNNMYMKDDLSSNNICREIYRQIFNDVPTRFVDLSSNLQYSPSKGPGFYHVPFIAGDTLNFKLTLKPALTQAASVPTGKLQSDMSARTYRVKLNIVA